MNKTTSIQITDDMQLTPEQKWNSATIANNFIFYKVMSSHPDVCKELLEILLEIEIDKIEIHNEETVQIDYGSKGIRLDVYAKNQSQAFSLEMQTTDTRELPERSRYYQGALDVQCLSSGQKYKELKDSYIIFICIPDIFNKGLAFYSFENLCREDTTIHLNDRALKYFFIANNCDKMLNEKQKSFLSLVVGQAPSDNFTKKVATLTEEAKQNTEWKRQYMEWERQRTYDFENGKEKGWEEATTKAAIAFYQNGVSLDVIAKSLNLTTEKVHEIIQEKIPIQG